MNRDELIKGAFDGIGQGQPEDYVLAPSAHAKSLADKAPALAAILQRAEIVTASRRYEQSDAAARSAQDTFKRTGMRANLAIFLATCIGAALLITVPLTPPAFAKPVLIILSVCAILCGALASMWLFEIRQGNLLEKWMTERAAAETVRLSYFLLVTNAQPTGESVIPLPLLQLEYFRRYQLDIQRAFYGNRGRDHEQAASKILGISAFAVLLASLASGLGGLLGGAAGARWVSIAALGTVAAALSAFASAQEALGQDRRNAERYSRTLAALDDLAGRMDAVRASAADGAQEPVQAFVAAVHEQLSLEHRQWLGTAESTKAALANLEQSLEKVKQKPPKTSDSG